MKLKTLLSVALLGLSGTAVAQSQSWKYDSVAMGAGYANDVYYDIKTGASNLRAGNDWDLAFQMTDNRDADFNATIRANHAKKSVEVYSLGYQASTKFGMLTPADTVGRTGPARQLYNDESSWGKGAFYQNRLTADPFSFGWGNYSMVTHNITGDSLFLVKVGGVAYQFWMQKYVSNPTDSISYIFRVAKMDGTGNTSVRIFRKDATGDFTNRLFAYYDLTSNTVVNHEPTARNGWDMMFTQYIAKVMGPGGLQPYVVTGVLSNAGTEVADIRQLLPDDINSTNFGAYFGAKVTKFTDEIGSDWKTFDQTTFKYKMDDSGSFIVKSVNTKEYWQIHFTRFDGGSPSAGGKIEFRKRFLRSALSVPAIASQALTAWAVSPNPTSAEATLMLDAKKATVAQLMITDMAGRTVQTSALDLKSGVNAFNLNTSNWPAGIYAVQVAATDWKVSSRLVVTH